MLNVIWIPAVIGSKSTVLAAMVPSESKSFEVTLIFTTTSSVPVMVSLSATGKIFGATRMVIVAMLDVAS